MLIDTHVHLNHEDLADAGVRARARDAGVGGFVVIGFDLLSSGRAVALAESDPDVWAVVGIHPHDAARYNRETGAQLRAWANNPRVVAIGEIGLDFYRDLSPRDVQAHAFAAQLALARNADLPVVIHCRDAYDETLAMLEAWVEEDTTPAPPVVLHCFGGERRHAERAWRRGWFLGIGGALTFKNSGDLRDIVCSAPAECLLLETDAPYLSPVPLRGRYPNEPARLPFIAEALAELRGATPAQIADLTTENARRAFPRLRVETAISGA